ncbi:uncharacterized protein LOC132735486 [Ruditapes philippinarum]|uniref:uncharacterized protein LOC132735486 n=1 Tax=Ruditapes philippinarum TaxID=129788 RepID=UPI00295BE5EF|nr:uncharacterized protein LOC132735486 [Ruditapes philippinarum]
MEAGENVRLVNESDFAEVEHTVTDEDYESVALAEVKSPTFGFTEPSWRTDLCLVVEGTKLYVAKNILSLASPVFDAMFQSDFKEKSSDELELPGKKLKDVLEFLRCIYPNTYTQINRDNARIILPLLEEYQNLQLKPRCEVVILETVTEETSTNDLLQLLNEACLYDLKALRARCIFLISSRPCDALDENYCKSFPSASALNEIFVNVYTSMKKKLVELEEVAEENALFKQYISSEIRNGKKDLKLDPAQKWDDKTIVIIDVIPEGTKESKGVYTNIWVVPLKINIQNNGGRLYIKVENISENTIICDISVLCIQVNRQPRGKNNVVVQSGSFNSFLQHALFEILGTHSIEQVGKGYIFNGKIGVIAQVFMSKPNK